VPTCRRFKTAGEQTMILWTKGCRAANVPLTSILSVLDSTEHRLTFLLFLTAFACNVLSSTYLLHFDEEWLYWSKHLSLVVLACSGLCFYALRAFLTLSLPISVMTSCLVLATSPYLLHGELGVALFVESASTVVACVAVARLWESQMIFRMRWPCLFISMLPLLIDVTFDSGQFIYNTYYGRARLLLGYWHPKEAGIAILFALMLFKLRRQRLFNKVDLFAIPLLWFIQSRNGLLFYLNYIAISYLIRRFGIGRAGGILAIFYICSPLLLFVICQHWLDTSSSGRLTFWSSAQMLFSADTMLDTSLLVNGEAGLRLDNSYLECYLAAGLSTLIVLVSALLVIVGMAGRRRIANAYQASLVLSFMIYCFFDSGLFSTGHFLNFLVFPVLLANPMNTLSVDGHSASDAMPDLTSKNPFRKLSLAVYDGSRP
jgi:hypothetical protein